MEVTDYLLGKKAGGGSGGTTNYDQLTNKPSINGVELSGNKSSEDLGIGGETYVIAVSGDGTSNFTNVDTASNRTVIKKIYDNYQNINPQDVCIVSNDSGRIKKFNVRDINLQDGSGNTKYLLIDTTYIYAGHDVKYGIDYGTLNQNYIFVIFTSDEITSISSSSYKSLVMEENYDIIGKSNTTSYTPTSNYNPSTKLYTDKTHYENMAGYDSSKTQILKNINGTLTWVDE